MAELERMKTLLYIFCQLLVTINCVIFNDDSQPKQIVDASNSGLTFEGNTNVPDHFKLLERDGEFLLIGARDIVYNISMNNFNAFTPFVWRSTEDDVDLCTMKGKSKEECHNYIRILAKQSETDLLICGTNSYKPKCRQYKYHQNGTYVEEKEFSGSGICPYDPSHNSTAFYYKEKNELYAGTVADFAGTDPLVSKRQIETPDDLGLRTERSDSKCLNDPNFVSSFADEDHVYFWFREGAVEHMNCGKAVYSRVSRVCKNDRGGPRANSDTWTTFLKARLNCSIPGDYPFYFDEIESTSTIIRSGRSNELIYAVFTTPYNSIRASAVCAFSLDSIRRIFSQSAYKAQSSPNANWLPILRSQVPQPRPGDCESDSTILSEEAVNFVKRNPLMDESVPNYFSAPLLIHSGFKPGVRFTQIAVDAQVATIVETQKYDVIFVGTDDGRVIKFVNVADGQNVKSVIVEIVKVFRDKFPVKNLLIDRRNSSASRLVIVTDEAIKSLPLHNCQNAATCSECVQLQDPYCAWDVSSKKCIGSSTGSWSHGSFVQSVKDGDPKECSGETLLEIATKDPPLDNSVQEPLSNRNHIAIDSVPKGPATIHSNDNQTRRKDNTLFSSRIPCECSKHLHASMRLALVNENDAVVDLLDDDNHAPVITAERSLQQSGSYTTPMTVSSTTMFVALFASAIVAFVVGAIVGFFALPRCKYFKNKNDKLTKIPSNKNVVFPNGSVINGGISTGSASPLTSEKSPTTKIPMEEFHVNLDDDLTTSGSLSNHSPQHSSMYSSKTLPHDFKVKRTYL